MAKPAYILLGSVQNPEIVDSLPDEFTGYALILDNKQNIVGIVEGGAIIAHAADAKTIKRQRIEIDALKEKIAKLETSARHLSPVNTDENLIAAIQSVLNIQLPEPQKTAVDNALGQFAKKSLRQADKEIFSE